MWVVPPLSHLRFARAIPSRRAGPDGVRLPRGIPRCAPSIGHLAKSNYSYECASFGEAGRPPGRDACQGSRGYGLVKIAKGYLYAPLGH